MVKTADPAGTSNWFIRGKEFPVLGLGEVFARKEGTGVGWIYWEME